MKASEAAARLRPILEQLRELRDALPKCEVCRAPGIYQKRGEYWCAEHGVALEGDVAAPTGNLGQQLEIIVSALAMRVDVLERDARSEVQS